MFIILLAIWLILNGSVSLHTVLVGSAISLLLTAFCRAFLDYRPMGLRTLRRLPRYIGYALYVVGQIVLSCLAVCRFIYSGREPRPVLIRFDPGLKKDVSRVMLANSITLTPGTITVNVRDGIFFVHALDRDFGRDIEKGGFVRRLKRLEDDAL